MKWKVVILVLVVVLALTVSAFRFWNTEPIEEAVIIVPSATPYTAPTPKNIPTPAVIPPIPTLAPCTPIPELEEPQPLRNSLSDDIETATVLAKVMWGEARGIWSQTQQACVAWCIINRYDSGEFQDTIIGCATARAQFNYSSSFGTVDDYGRDLVELARDILSRYEREQSGAEDVGRVLPKEYMWFGGDGSSNWFRNSHDAPYMYWYYTLESPYDS